MHSIKHRVCFAAFGLMTMAADADSPRFELFSGASLLKLTGTTTTSFGSTYDLDRDLHLDASPQYQLDLHLAPARRWWPDFEFGYAHLNGNGSGIATTPVTAGSVTVVSGSALLSRIAFNDYSLAVEAPLSLFGVTIEPGLTVKYLQGNVDISNTNTDVIGGAVAVNGLTSHQNIDRVFPLAHLRFAADLAPWLRLSGGGNYIRYGHDEVYEYGARADVRAYKTVGLSAGYQRRHYKVEDALYRTNATLNGLFFGLSLDTGG